MSIDYPWYWIVACVAAGAAMAWLLYRRSHLVGWLRWAMAGLRGLTVALIAMLLLGPVVSRQVNEKQRPVVVLLQDVSGSVEAERDSLFSFATLADALSDRFEVVVQPFGTDDYTDIASALSDPSLPSPSAMVVASDGIANRGASPASVSVGWRVYTVGLGDTAMRRDAALTHVRANRYATLGNRFRVEVSLAATMLTDKRATLSVRRDGSEVARQQVDYEGEAFAADFGFDLEADRPGLQAYSLWLSPIEGELSEANNGMSFYIDVIDTRRNVAIVGNAPHPDLGALRQAIDANPNYEAHLFLATDASDMQRLQRTLPDYNLLVLHNLPSAQHLPPTDAEVPTLYVIGTATDLARFNALHTGLEITARSRKVNEVTAMRNSAFGLFSLPDDASAIVEQMPPLQALFGEAKSSAALQSLFTARLADIDTRLPLVAALSDADGRRAAFVWGEGLWRWRLDDYRQTGTTAHFDQLVSQLLGFAALTQQQGRLKVDAERRYALHSAVHLSATLLNASLQPTTDPDMTLHLHSDSLDADYTLARSGGIYTLQLPDLPEGLYRYRAEADGQTDEGSFVVEALHLEQRQMRADHAALRALAANNGGFMTAPDSMSRIADALADIKPKIYSHRTHSELLGLPWLWMLIVAMLGTEWVVRKYHGDL